MIILRQKEYARKDYEGLNKVQRIELKKKRDELAKWLNERRKVHNDELGKSNKKSEEIAEKGLKTYKNLNYVKDSENREERVENFGKKLNEDLKRRKKENLKFRDELHDFSLKQAKRDAETAREGILSQSSGRKFKNYNKALWNGDIGISKGANRALMVGIPAAVGLTASGIALHRKNKKKKEERKNDSTKN